MSLKKFIKPWLVAVAFSFSVPAVAQDLQTVESVDVERYLGKWFEIASFPEAFQSGCQGTVAEYSLNEDGSIKVFNSCKLFSASKGIPINITGRATPIDESNSKLELTFFGGLTRGNYWILELDPDYQWALIGEPTRDSLFILNREAAMDDAVYNEIVDLAVTKHGYDISKLKKTKQIIK